MNIRLKTGDGAIINADAASMGLPKALADRVLLCALFEASPPDEAIDIIMNAMNRLYMCEPAGHC
jgi:hypothetical protein